MRLILIGCEYAGTTTLGHAICVWSEEAMGADYNLMPDGTFDLLHDHYKIPHTSGHGQLWTDQEQTQVLGLSPRIKEMVQRHSLHYHIKPTNYDRPDHIVIGLHIEDAIYGPLYFGYGGEGRYGDRHNESRRVEEAILRLGPDTVLVLIKADADVIQRRMRENPHPNATLREPDVDLVLRRFQEEFDRSSFSSKITIDTSRASVEESLAEFVERVQPMLSEVDRKRLRSA